jgi:hypothetical protein
LISTSAVSFLVYHASFRVVNRYPQLKLPDFFIRRAGCSLFHINVT